MRDQLLAALRARIEATTETGDTDQVLADPAVAEADRLLGFLAQDNDVDVEIMLVAGLFHWVRGSVLTGDDGTADRSSAAVLLLPLYLNRPEVLPDPVRESITAVLAESGPDGQDRRQLFAEAWSNLGMLLLERLIRQGERRNGPAAVVLLRTATGALPADHPSRPLVLCNLGYALMIGDTDEDGAPRDVDEGVVVLREAFAGTPVGHPNYTRCANGLALVLRAKASQTQDGPLLIEAIELFRTAVAHATELDQNLPRILHDFALSLLVWAESGPGPNPDAIREAIAALERSLTLTSQEDPEFGERWTMLSRAQLARVTHEARAREPEPADEFGRPFEDAMAHLASPDGSDGGDNLFVAVLQLLNMDDAEGDSRHAHLVDFQRTLMRYPHEASLAEVQAKALETIMRRFDHLDPAERPEALRRYLESEKPPPAEPVDPAILDEIIELHDRLLPELADRTDLEPEVSQVVRLTRGLLAMAQTMAWGRGVGQATPETLAEMRTRFASAMEWLPQLENMEIRGQKFTAERMLSASARGRALLSPFEVMAVNESTVKRYRQRLAELSPHDPERLLVRGYLANALFGRYNMTSEEHVFAEAVGLVRQVIAEAWPPPNPTIVASWGNSAASRIQRMGLGKVPLDPTGDQRSTGSATVALTSQSVADAVAVGDGVDALESLEEGRALMLSTALHTRREVDTLRAADPELAQRFVALRDEIYVLMNPGMEPRPGAQERYVELDAEWGELIDQIKTLPGFDRFLMPVSLSVNDLLPAGADGPVVTINVHPHRCDALAVRADGVRVIPLPDLGAAELVEHADSFHTAIGVLSAPGRDQRSLAVGAAQQAIRDTLGWLWDVLAEPVLTELGFNGVPPDGRPWPRLWWSPTGPLNFLPLHAAGHHDVFGMAVLDRVVSSYTPTVRALLHSRSHSAAARRTALAVAMPITEGHAGLPATADEITAFAGRFPGRVPLVGPTATREAVLSALPDAAVAHFACHASSDPADPSASHLLLHDGPLSLREISQLHLDHAELAYLSACATARGGMGVADEAIHIASAFQLAGYAQAVGTMWEIEDRVAARVAAEFHRELSETINDPVRPAGAHALHTVTRRLRTELTDRPWLWAAYLHAGA
ncbi:MAG TPA: CHAT domain-containing protein [Pseudonocardiaceae bacterium]|jgi:hypothetical protein|nr:CHAT domain-containing protein [Pseudonocardiaceae bacterium]